MEKRPHSHKKGICYTQERLEKSNMQLTSPTIFCRNQAHVPHSKNTIYKLWLTLQKKKRMTAKEREQKRVEKCLRRRLSWCNKAGNSYETGLEQYSIYPRAIADCNKGSKANWTHKLIKRDLELSSSSDNI